MAATKQYTQVKTAEKPLPPKPLFSQQQNILPIILAQNPSNSSVQPVPILVQSSDGQALQMAYPHSAPSQHYIYAHPLVENQVSNFKSTSYDQNLPDQSTVRMTYSPPQHNQEHQEAGTSYPHPRLASFNHEPPHQDSAEGRSIAESTTYPLTPYFSLPTPGSSPQSSLAMQLQSYEFPPGHHRDRRFSTDSSNGYELPSGARRRRRYSRTNPAYSYDPFEASDVETDETPVRSSRSNRPSMTHHREDSFPPPSRQFQHHRERRKSTVQNSSIPEQTSVNRRRSHANSLSVPNGPGVEYEEEEHIIERRARSPSSHRPRPSRRRSNSLPPPSENLTVPADYAHTSHHRSRHHRYTSVQADATQPSFGHRSRALSYSTPTTEQESHQRQRHSRKDSDHRSRSKSRARGKSRIRSKSTSYQPSDSDGSYSDDERPNIHLRDFLPDALRSRGGKSDNSHNKRNTMLGGLGGAVLGNALLPGVGTALGPAVGAAMGGLGGHEMSKDGVLEGAQDKAKKKWAKKQREWEAGRKAGAEEGRRIGMQMARKKAEERARVQRRERGGTSMGGVGGGGG